MASTIVNQQPPPTIMREPWVLGTLALERLRKGLREELEGEGIGRELVIEVLGE